MSSSSTARSHHSFHSTIPSFSSTAGRYHHVIVLVDCNIATTTSSSITVCHQLIILVNSTKVSITSHSSRHAIGLIAGNHLDSPSPSTSSSLLSPVNLRTYIFLSRSTPFHRTTGQKSMSGNNLSQPRILTVRSPDSCPSDRSWTSRSSISRAIG